jgi:hypothetical protein
MRGESLRPWGITLLRVIIGVIFLMHGWQKLTAFGVNGVTGMFANLGIPLPNVFAIIVIAVEHGRRDSTGSFKKRIFQSEGNRASPQSLSGLSLPRARRPWCGLSG